MYILKIISTIITLAALIIAGNNNSTLSDLEAKLDTISTFEKIHSF